MIHIILRKPVFANAKTKTLIGCAVTVKLISAFGFTSWIMQSVFLKFLYTKFQASSLLLASAAVCVEPGRKPEDRFDWLQVTMTSFNVLRNTP